MPQNLRELQTARQPDLEADIKYKSLGYVMAAVGAVMFSLKAILIKLAYAPETGLEENALPALTLLFLRMAFSAPVYLALLIYLLKRKPEIRQSLNRDLIMKAIGVGLLSYCVCSWLDFQGLKYITAQLERLLLFTYPAFVFLLGAMFFGRKLSLWGIGCILIAYSGLALIFARGGIAQGELVWLGASLVLFCALIFALSQLWAKIMVGKIGALAYTCIAMLGATAALSGAFFAVNAPDIPAALDLPPRVLVLAASIAVLSTLIPSFLINLAMTRIDAQSVATIGMLSPLATALMAVWVLGEPFGLVDGIGTLLTMLGIGMYSWFDRRRIQTHP